MLISHWVATIVIPKVESTQIDEKRHMRIIILVGSTNFIRHPGLIIQTNRVINKTIIFLIFCQEDSYDYLKNETVIHVI